MPAAIILITTGEVRRGIALAGFCGLVIGSVDNLLRPLLVGRDTQMHELLIFFSTLGGLLLFGVMGFILGPILAALFVTVWEMFGSAFRSSLAEPMPITPERIPALNDSQQYNDDRDDKQDVDEAAERVGRGHSE